MQQRAQEVADLYDRLNMQQRGREWTTEQLALGFVGDCLWAVLVLAARSNVDLHEEFDRCMAQLTTRIEDQLA